MELLFKRDQRTSISGKAIFKLWAKVELDDGEKAVVAKYRFDKAVLIERFQPTLFRKSVIAGLIAALVVWLLMANTQIGQIMLAEAQIAGVSHYFKTLAPGAAGLLFGYLYYDTRRETIFVKDLLHGRHVSCDGIVDLAKAEAYITDAVGFLRQVMESAKHWDGTQAIDVPVLPKDEARQFIIQYG